MDTKAKLCPKKKASVIQIRPILLIMDTKAKLYPKKMGARDALSTRKWAFEWSGMLEYNMILVNPPSNTLRFWEELVT